MYSGVFKLILIYTILYYVRVMGNGYIYIHSVFREVKMQMYFCPAFYLRLEPFLGCITYCYMCVCMFGVMGKAQQTNHMLVLSPPVVTSSRGPGA